jgi:hypothetical protein
MRMADIQLDPGIRIPERGKELARNHSRCGVGEKDFAMNRAAQLAYS